MKSKSDFFMLGLKKSFIIVSNFEIFWSIPWHDIPAKQIFSINVTTRDTSIGKARTYIDTPVL